MIKVPIISDNLFQSLKKEEVKLSHYPNMTLCWTVKNRVNEVRIFEYNHIKSARKFSVSKSYLY